MFLLKQDMVEGGTKSNGQQQFFLTAELQRQPIIPIYLYLIFKISIMKLIFKHSHSISERYYISIFPSFLPSDPKPQFQYLHNQQLCQFISDWLLRLDTRILTKILEIQYENSVVNYFLKIILIKTLTIFMVI